MVDYRPLVDNIDPVAALTLGKLDSTPRAGGLPPHEGGALALRSGAAGGGWTGPHCPVQGTESLALGSELPPSLLLRQSQVQCEGSPLVRGDASCTGSRVQFPQSIRLSFPSTTRGVYLFRKPNFQLSHILA